jgi:hypothetical protein
MAQMPRTDWGGKNPDGVIQNMLNERGLASSPELLSFIRELCERQVAGCRVRMSSSIDELRRRHFGAQN